jgi:hypothetical protein
MKSETFLPMGRELKNLYPGGKVAADHRPGDAIETAPVCAAPLRRKSFPAFCRDNGSRQSSVSGRRRQNSGRVDGVVQYTRSFQPEEHRHHHQVARAERAIQPVGSGKATGKLAQPVTDAIHDERHALRGPGLVALKEPGGSEFKDRRLQRAERGEHPHDHARPGVRISAAASPMHCTTCVSPQKRAFQVSYTVFFNM